MRKNDYISDMRMRFLLFLFAASTFLCGCSSDSSNSSDSESSVEQFSLRGQVSRDLKFGSIKTDIPVEDFFLNGAQFGDAFDVEFSGGLSFENVPFFNGYYTESGGILLCAYQGQGNVELARSNISTFWEESGLSEGDSVTIVFRESGEYRTVQETFDMHYSDNQKDYPSEVAFANFRAAKAGNIAVGRLYRGASPFDKAHNRPEVVNQLIQEAGIRFILDLADSEEEIVADTSEKGNRFEYSAALLEDGRYAALDMSSDYNSSAFKKALIKGLELMIQFDGPYYVHCQEGKDRTGFVMTLLEALMGASYDEMETDYMITYDNYFQISKKNNPEKYEAVVNLRFKDFIRCLVNSSAEKDLHQEDYSDFAAEYLKSGGMAADEIETLKKKLK